MNSLPFECVHRSKSQSGRPTMMMTRLNEWKKEHEKLVERQVLVGQPLTLS